MYKESPKDRWYGIFVKSLAITQGIWYNICDFQMCMLDEIRAKRDEIYAIAKKHKAEKLWVFGSCARKMVMKFSSLTSAQTECVNFQTHLLLKTFRVLQDVLCQK